MSVASAIRKMIARGFTVEQALLAAETMEEETPPREKTVSARPDRNARYYEKNRERLVEKAALRRVKTSEPTERAELIKTSEASELCLNASELFEPSCVDTLAEPELTKLEISGKKNKKTRKRISHIYPSEFELLVHEYRENDRTVKALAFAAWQDLSDQDQDRCLDAVGPYHALLDRERRGGFNRGACGLQVFINQRRFDDLLGQQADDQRNGNSASLHRPVFGNARGAA